MMGNFWVVLKGTNIGCLSHNDEGWFFKYTEAAKQFAPIFGFPNFDVVYSSKSLWPFFSSRIPSMKQPTIKEIIFREQIDSRDLIQLLKRFGRSTITNPYKLIPYDQE